MGTTAPIILIGEGDCTIDEILQTLSVSPTFSVLARNWTRVARTLGILDERIDRYKRQYDFDVHVPFEDIFGWVLQEYSKNDESSIQRLILAFKKHTLNRCAKLLLDRYHMILNDDDTFTQTQSNANSRGEKRKNLDKNEDEVDLCKKQKGLVHNLPQLPQKLKRPASWKEFTDSYYEIPKDKIGFALILNCVDGRDGAILDSKNFEYTFRELKYTVLRNDEFYSAGSDQPERKWLNNIIMDFKKEIFAKQATVHSIAVFIGGHGSDRLIETTDKKRINYYNEIIYKFCNDEKEMPKMLWQIPKLFFVESCAPFNFLQTDDVTSSNTNPPASFPMSDVAIWHSTYPGGFAVRDPNIGSLFVYWLRMIFLDNAHEMDLKEMMYKVSEEMIGSVTLEKGKPTFAYFSEFFFTKKFNFFVAPESKS